MMPSGRCGFLPAALLITTGLASSACAVPDEAAGPESTIISKPAQPESFLSLGNRMLAAREPDLAMKAFLSSMSVEGISVEAMTGAGIAAKQQGLLKSARRYFEQARKLAPDSVLTHNNLGVVLYMMKEYYPARNEFRSAFALSSGRSGIAERNLNRVEAKIARIEKIPEEGSITSQETIHREDGEIRPVESTSNVADTMAE
jgi:Flp pilus assembly protein TadD